MDLWLVLTVEICLIAENLSVLSYLSALSNRSLLLPLFSRYRYSLSAPEKTGYLKSLDQLPWLTLNLHLLQYIHIVLYARSVTGTTAPVKHRSYFRINCVSNLIVWLPQKDYENVTLQIWSLGITYGAVSTKTLLTYHHPFGEHQSCAPDGTQPSGKTINAVMQDSEIRFPLCLVVNWPVKQISLRTVYFASVPTLQ